MGKHEWSAVCDEKGNQIDDFIVCDLCGARVRSWMIDSKTGNIRRSKLRSPGEIRKRWGV